MTPRTRCAIAVGAVSALTVLAYLPSFRVPFQFDDYGRIGENAALQRGDYLEALHWLGISRLLPGLALVANYAIGGDEPFGYHVFNLLVHGLAALGVFALARGLCRAPRLRASAAARHPLATATAAALVFACHPLQTQAVTYIVQRYASMAALFYVWSVVWYVHARNRHVGAEPGSPRRAGAIALGLAFCAVLSKENAISLPLAVLLTEWVAFGRLPSRRLLVRGALLLLILGAVPVVWRVATWRPMVRNTESLPLLERLVAAVMQRQASGAPPEPLAYLLTQATVLPRYLLLVVRPWGLNVDHDVPIAEGITATVVGGVLFLAVLIAAGLVAARRWPLVGYGIVWMFIALSVESSILPITDVMMEHRMYLAMPGIALAAGSVFAIALERAPRAAPALGGAAVAALVALTFARNVVWQSPLTLWVDAADKSPAKARVHVNAGVAHHGANRLDDAVRHYCRALQLDPDIGLAEDNLEIALDAQGKLEDVGARLIGPSLDQRTPGMLVIEVDLAGTYCPQ